MKTKKIISVLTAAALLFCALFAVTAFADYNENGIDYTPQGSGYAVKKINSGAGENVVIPSEVDGLPVIAIIKEAARGSGTLRTVTVPSSVTNVGEYAFAGCANLKSAVFESGAPNVSLKASCFSDCFSLESVTLPATRSIPSRCFSGCISLGSVELPAALQTIGTESFLHCASLTQVEIPANVTGIGSSAFYNCTKVTAYSVDSANTSYKADGGVLYTADGKTLVQYPIANSPKSFSVPEGTTAIADGAFANSTVGHIILPSTLESIGGYAFCDSTVSMINFPKGLKTIGSNAFLRCGALREITLPGTLTSFDEAFVDSGLETVTFEEGLTSVSPNAFKSCSKLKSVKLPSTAGKIMYGAFNDCGALENVNIPASVTAIGNNAFGGCDSLTLTVTKGSYGETYAADNSIPFVYDQGEVDPPVTEELKAEILGYKSSLSVGYKTSVTFHAKVSGSSDYKLTWVVDGREYPDSGSLSYTVRSATGSYSVKCVVTSGGKSAESGTETVTVSTNLFAKIVYFFRNIFSPDKLVIDQK